MKQSISINDFLSFTSLSHLKANPSQNKVAFVASKANEKENGYDQQIYIYEDNRLKQLTSMKKESSFSWKDDTTILFAAKRFKEEQDQTDQTTIYQIATDGGEATKAYTLPIPVSQFELLPDGNILLKSPYHLDHPHFYNYSVSKRKAIKDELKENDYFVELNQIPFWFNGTQYIDSMRSRLFIFDTEKKSLTPLFTLQYDVSHFQLNYAKTKAYIFCERESKVGPLKNKVFELDLSSLETKPMITTNQYSLYSAFEINEAVYLIGTDNQKLGLNQNPSIYKYLEENKLEELHNDINLGNSIGSDVRYGSSRFIIQPNTDEIILNTTVDGHSELLSFDGNDLTTIHTSEGSIDGFDYLNKELVTIGLYNMQLHELYDKDENKLTNFNKELPVIHPEKLEFNSHGDDISGWVLVPTETPTKAILDIHGGPKTAYGPVYYHEMQVWANNGYLVMFCNPHGSSGKGDTFSDIRGKYGTIDYEDIMTFVDRVLEQYPSIKEVGVTGGSYGGFMTNWIIGHTDRFKCAITQRSISNWLSFNGVSDIGYYFTEDQNAGHFYSEEGQQKLWEHSPLKYASNFNTPTLVIHSTDDYRCPIDQGYQMFSALVDRRVEAKMLIVKGENHDLSRSGKPKARIKRLTEMTNWFDKYLIVQ